MAQLEQRRGRGRDSASARPEGINFSYVDRLLFSSRYIHVFDRDTCDYYSTSFYSKPHSGSSGHHSSVKRRRSGSTVLPESASPRAHLQQLSRDGPHNVHREPPVVIFLQVVVQGPSQALEHQTAVTLHFDNQFNDGGWDLLHQYCQTGRKQENKKCRRDDLLPQIRHKEHGRNYPQNTSCVYTNQNNGNGIP